ncbi:MAG TPA: acyltransferase family protein [Methanocorpusculum sp.]|nr:acyltransferase family protein [Methanocorpusculum sp.]
MTDTGDAALPNTGRQFNFDFIKMIIIFGLVFVHLYERCFLLEDYSVSHIGFDTVESGISTIVEFADGTIGACMFMFCLGVGLVYSRRKTAGFLFKRAWVMLAAAFGLALLTNTISLTILSQINQNPSLFEQGIWWLFCSDILNFAFLTFLFFSLVRKFKIPNIIVLAVPVILLIIAAFIPKMLFPDNIIASDLIGWFVFQDNGYSFFPFMQWLIFPAAGYVFAQALQKTNSREKFYGWVMLTGAAAFALITAVSVLCGIDIATFFSSHNGCIYNKTLLSALWSLSFSLFWAALIFFLTRKVKQDSRLHRFAEKTSRRITVFYCLQWIIIGFLGFWIFPALNMMPLNLIQYFTAAVIIIIVCYLLSGLILKKVQKKRIKE